MRRLLAEQRLTDARQQPPRGVHWRVGLPRRKHLAVYGQSYVVLHRGHRCTELHKVQPICRQHVDLARTVRVQYRDAVDAQLRVRWRGHGQAIPAARRQPYARAPSEVERRGQVLRNIPKAADVAGTRAR